MNGQHPVSESPIHLVYECSGSSFAFVSSDDAGKVAYALVTWYVDMLHGKCSFQEEVVYHFCIRSY
jgi:hypothetical protein